jgi:fructose-1,6-bisphosphatase I
MNEKRISLTRYLVEHQREHSHIQPQLRLLIEVVARACKHIAISVNKGALGEVLGRPTPRTCRARCRRSWT